MSEPSPLAPCPACQRHVRTRGERACPFCGGALPEGLAPKGPLPRRRLSRAAAIALAAGLTSAGVAAEGCSSSDPGPVVGDGGTGDAAPQADTADTLLNPGEAGVSYGSPPVVERFV